MYEISACAGMTIFMKRFVPIVIGIIIFIFGLGTWLSRQSFFSISTTPNAQAQTPAENTPTHHASFMDPAFYDAFFAADVVTTTITEKAYSAVVPHHLVAGRYEANFFKMMANQNPEVVILVGPNHPDAGKNAIVSGLQNWRTPYGELKVNTFLVDNLSRNKAVALDDNLIGDENSIGAVVPFIKKTWPNTTLVPIILKSTARHADLDALRNEIYRLGYGGAKTLIITSVDFSHYLPQPVANFHDELSGNVLATGDMNRLGKLEIDSEPSLYFLLAYNQSQGAQHFNLVSHTNSATLSGQPNLKETTSHFIGYYISGRAEEAPLTTLQFFGDIMIDRNVAKSMGSRGLDYVFANLKGEQNRFFKGVDLFVANLEGPFAPSRIQTSKSIAFRFDPKWAAQFKKYNFGVLSLANNHSYDMGIKNIGYTRSVLAAQGIGYFGDQLREGPAYTWFATNTPETIAFIGVENVTHEPNKAAIQKAIEDARAKAKYVIIFPHMGTEYKQISNTAQRSLYHWLIDSGADAVIAAHPHVVEESEVYNGKPIFYSLGNFIFDQYFSKETQEGLSVGLTLQDGKVKNMYLFPMQQAASQVSLMNGTRRDAFLEWMGKNSRLDGRVVAGGRVDVVSSSKY